MDLGEIKAQRHFTLAAQGLAQRGGRDVGVAVAVAADPVAHAQEGRHGVAGQGAFHFTVQPRDFAQKRRLVVRQRILDLVGHGQPGGAQHARLPQLRHAGLQQRFVVRTQTRRDQIVAFGQVAGHGAFGVKNALALHLGGVGREHRRDAGRGQHLRNIGPAVVSALQALEGHGQRAFLVFTGVLVHRTAAQVVAVLGDVGQVAEVAERADDGHRLVR